MIRCTCSIILFCQLVIIFFFSNFLQFFLEMQMIYVNNRVEIYLPYLGLLICIVEILSKVYLFDLSEKLIILITSSFELIKL